MNHPTQAKDFSGVNVELTKSIITQSNKYHDVSTMAERLLDALKRHGSLSIDQCGKYDINHVAQRIADLRKAGWFIKTTGKGRGKTTIYTLLGFHKKEVSA